MIGQLKRGTIALAIGVSMLGGARNAWAIPGDCGENIHRQIVAEQSWANYYHALWLCTGASTYYRQYQDHLDRAVEYSRDLGVACIA